MCLLTHQINPPSDLLRVPQLLAAYSGLRIE